MQYRIAAGGMTVKTYLRRHLGFSARVLIGLKQREGGIAVNGLHAKVTQLLCEGDVLSLDPADGEKTAATPEDLPLNILYEDEHFLVVDKPPGMAMYPVGSHSGGSLLNAVSFHRDMVFRPVYRLDRNTSGLVVVGKNRLAASSAQLKKTYFAVCCGELPPWGTLDEPIGLAPGSKIKRITGCGQPALTRFCRLGFGGGYSLAQVEIETGRTHQIRVHMAQAGFPLAGDDLYGGCCERISRQALHCGRVLLRAVPLGIEKTLVCGVPEDIRGAFADLFYERVEA